jgi:uncharacterized protein (TIGR02453 family)
MPKASFSPALFTFLRQLKANNDRDWFKANQAKFEDAVRTPALEFVRDMAPRLEALSPHFLASDKKVGGSLFRIHRDTRFSKDKTPYKTHTGIQFRHEEGKSAHAPCFYLHLEPGEVFVGAGIWRPDTATAKRIREAIVEDPQAWKKATQRKAFTKRFALSGESLKRPPRGFDAEHPLLEDLKRKDFIAVAKLTQRDVTSGDVPKTFSALCKTSAPLVEFLCDALELPY